MSRYGFGFQEAPSGIRGDQSKVGQVLVTCPCRAQEGHGRGLRDIHFGGPSPAAPDISPARYEGWRLYFTPRARCFPAQAYGILRRGFISKLEEASEGPAAGPSLALL